MTAGDLIKQYRDMHSMTMDEFAMKSGLSKGYISMLENNINPRNNKPISPTITSLQKVATGLDLDLDQLMRKLDNMQNVVLSNYDNSDDFLIPDSNVVKIPVLGRVAAGIPLNAIEEIIDWEEIPKAMASDGEYFALQIKGDSMEPKISNLDVVIVRKQSTATDGDIVIALINGDDAVCKRFKKYQDGIALLSSNPAYEPLYFSNEEIEKKPVQILGKVKELRAKFK